MPDQVHEFLPDRFCKKGHATIKRYPSGAETCLTCAKGARKDREQRIVAGIPPTHPKRTKPEMRKAKMQIAAMAGAGLAPAAIAVELDLNQDRVEQIIRKDVKSDDELRALFKEAERKLAPIALETASKLLNHIGKVAEGYNVIVGKDEAGNPIVKHVDTAPQHAAQALREMRPFIGLGDRPAMGDAASGVQEALANAMQKPEVAAAVVQAIMAARQKQLVGRSE